MKTTWVNLPAPFSKYAVSDTGLCKNIKTEKIHSQKFLSGGYVKYSLYADNMEKRIISAHRIVYYGFNPNEDKALVVDHIDGNKLNNKIENLQALTSKAHTAKTGLSRRGEKKKKPMVADTCSDEIWRPLPFNTCIFVSNLGKVKNRLGAITYGSLDGHGYFVFTLDGKRHFVHRLVAQAFIDQPNGCDIVNHIDEDKTNNKVSNLEWTTKSGNSKHSAYKVRKPVIATNCITGQETYFESLVNAALALNGSEKSFPNIKACIIGNQKTAYGHTYRWA